jgi:hypothetical protein
VSEAVENRAIFNQDRELLAQPVKVGNMVLSKGQLCELTDIGEGMCGKEGPSCVVAFRADTGRTRSSHTGRTRSSQGYCYVRFGNGDCTLVVDVWLHRVDEDASGLTFEEWDPSADTDASEAPVTMIVNSSDLCATGFDLREVIPLQLEAVARGGQRTRGAAFNQIHGMGTRRYVLSVDNDNDFRSRCE